MTVSVETGLQTKRREHINLPESGKQEGQAEKGANVVYPGQNLGMQVTMENLMMWLLYLFSSNDNYLWSVTILFQG